MHDDPFVRAQAAETLGMLGAHAQEATDTLEALTRDTDEGVAAAAKEALAKIKK
jgi:hypothetical protein